MIKKNRIFYTFKFFFNPLDKIFTLEEFLKTFLATVCNAFKNIFCIYESIINAVQVVFLEAGVILKNIQ